MFKEAEVARDCDGYVLLGERRVAKVSRGLKE